MAFYAKTANNTGGFQTNEVLVSEYGVLSETIATDNGFTSRTLYAANTTTSTQDNNDAFGTSVALDAETLVIGAPGRATYGRIYIATSTNGYGTPNQSNANYVATGNTWVNDAYGGNAPTGWTDSNFGEHVAVGCGRIVAAGSGSNICFMTMDGSEITTVDLSSITSSTTMGFNGQFPKRIAIGSGRVAVCAYNNNALLDAAFLFDLNGTLIKAFGHPSTSDDSFISCAIGHGLLVMSRAGSTLNGEVEVYSPYDGEYMWAIDRPAGLSTDCTFGCSLAVGSGRIVVGCGNSTTNIDSTSDADAYMFNLEGTSQTQLSRSYGFVDWGRDVAAAGGYIVVAASGNEFPSIGSGTFGTNSGGGYIVFDTDGNVTGGVHDRSDSVSEFRYASSIDIGLMEGCVVIVGGDPGWSGTSPSSFTEWGKVIVRALANSVGTKIDFLRSGIWYDKVMPYFRY